MGASGNIANTVTALVNDFNGINAGDNYTTWGNNYLYPTGPDPANNHIIIDKVDDPGQNVRGTTSDIITYLNDTQIGQFPRFTNSGGPPPIIRQDSKREGVAEVAGTGMYYNTSANYPDDGIPVQYVLRFKQSGGNWYLLAALVWPKA